MQLLFSSHVTIEGTQFWLELIAGCSAGELPIKTLTRFLVYSLKKWFLYKHRPTCVWRYLAIKVVVS